jgi:hypothetical protein
VRKISVWTEWLSEEWGWNSQNRQRIDRGRHLHTEIPLIIDRIRNLNGPDFECLLILQSKGRNLEISLRQHELHVSDPQDPNYQNVALAEGGLTDFIDHYFQLSSDEVSAHFLPAIILRIAFMALYICIVSGILIFLYYLFLSETGFFPKVEVTEIEDATQRQQLTREFSGIYATRVADGGMAIELKPEGIFRYYDLRKFAPGKFRLDEVTAGSWRPAYEGGQVALVTGVRYVFYSDGSDRILFLERPFDRIGTLPEDVPYLSFPEPPK